MNYTAGDFGRHWSNASSNTKVKLFKDYLEHLGAFNYKDHPSFDLDTLNWVTKQLRAKITRAH